MTEKEERLTEKEEKLSKEVMEEVDEEIKTETPEKIMARAKRDGTIGIIFGIMGLILPQPFAIFAGFIAMLGGRSAITKGRKSLGTTAAVLGFLDVITFVLFAGLSMSTFGI